jgi:hypothetical protein
MEQLMKFRLLARGRTDYLVDDHLEEKARGKRVK